MLIALSYLGAVSLAPPGFAQEKNPDDWVIYSSISMSNQSIRVPGTLVVRDGASLALNGADLAIGGHILVERGASIRLVSTLDRPTIVHPLEPSVGFWVDAKGELTANGTPSNPVRLFGLSGKGLSSTTRADGGIQIWGNATFDRAEISNGTAGVTIRPEGKAVFRNATIDSLGAIGLFSYSNLRLENSSVTRNGIGIGGRITCNVEVLNSTLASISDNVLLNSCPVTISNSILRDARASITANGDTHLNIRDSRLEGYGTSGVGAYPLPGPTGGYKRPTVRLDNVTLVPDVGARWGVELQSAEAWITNVESAGHVWHGIEATSGQLVVQNSTLKQNGGYGLKAQGAKVTMSGNDFGSKSLDTSNKQGSVSIRAIFNAVAAGLGGRPVPGLSLKVFTKDGLVAFSRENSTDAYNSVVIETYGVDHSGAPVSLGPFRYWAAHPELIAPVEGWLDESYPTLYIETYTSSFGNSAGDGLLILTTGAAIAGLILALNRKRNR